MSQKRSTNDIIESITGMLVHIAKSGTEKEKEDAIVIMEEGWKKMDEFDFNKELAKLWRQSLKAKKETKH